MIKEMAFLIPSNWFLPALFPFGKLFRVQVAFGPEGIGEEFFYLFHMVLLLSPGKNLCYMSAVGPAADDPSGTGLDLFVNAGHIVADNAHGDHENAGKCKKNCRSVK